VRPRILVVADDAALRGTLARWLMAADYRVELAEGPKRAREVVESGPIALAIVAADPADPASVDLVRELATAAGRLAILSDAPGVVERWAAIAVRLDAVIPRPLEEQQLLACIDALLPPSATDPTPPAPERLAFAELTLDVGGRTCRDAAGAEIALTRAEFSLLLELARHPGQVLSRGALSQAAAGREAGPDDRSVDVLISRLRRKVERDAKAPRLIVTVPGAGYKLMATPTMAALGAPTPSDTSFAADRESVASPHIVPVAVQERHATVTAAPSRWMLPVAGTSAACLIAAALFWYWGSASNQVFGPVAPKFDPAVVPLVNDAARKDLETYLKQPDFKALAISTEGWGYAQGASDPESARREALERCKLRPAGNKDCKIYAVGMNVVWQIPSPVQPLSADFRSEQLNIPFSSSVQDIRFISERIRKKMSEAYPTPSEHQAFALKGNEGLVWWTSTSQTAAEAARVTVERCSEFYQSPCLLIAVDSSMTVRIPKLHNPVGLFMLSNDRVFGEDRRQIAEIYAQKDWRALVRSRSGRWYAVANASSEAAAVEAALKSCKQNEPDCDVYAIGNFRVLGEQPPPASAGQPEWVPPYWAAIVSDGRGRWSYSLGQKTEDEAKNDAMHLCGAACRVDVIGQNRCLAFVESRSGGYWYGVSVGGSERNAADQAKEACQRGAPAGTCEVVKAFCG